MRYNSEIINRETSRALNNSKNLRDIEIVSRLRSHFHALAIAEYQTEHKNEKILSEQLREINQYFGNYPLSGVGPGVPEK